MINIKQLVYKALSGDERAYRNLIRRYGKVTTAELQSREQDMQTIIELGQIARPIIIIGMTIGTIFSLPVLLSLVDDSKRD